MFLSWLNFSSTSRRNDDGSAIEQADADKTPVPERKLLPSNAEAAHSTLNHETLAEIRDSVLTSTAVQEVILSQSPNYSSAYPATSTDNARVTHDIKTGAELEKRPLIKEDQAQKTDNRLASETWNGAALRSNEDTTIASRLFSEESVVSTASHQNFVQQSAIDYGTQTSVAVGISLETQTSNAPLAESEDYCSSVSLSSLTNEFLETPISCSAGETISSSGGHPTTDHSTPIAPSDHKLDSQKTDPANTTKAVEEEEGGNIVKRKEEEEEKAKDDRATFKAESDDFASPRTEQKLREYGTCRYIEINTSYYEPEQEMSSEEGDSEATPRAAPPTTQPQSAPNGGVFISVFWFPTQF